MTSNKTVYAGWEETDVPGMLNGEDHYAYVVAYEDGTVRPGGNISRAEVATIFFRLLQDQVRQENLTTDSAFADVGAGDWYNTAISTMARLGVINGRNSGLFDPDANITRAEFAAICARFDARRRRRTTLRTPPTTGRRTRSPRRGAGLDPGIQRRLLPARPVHHPRQAVTMINRCCAACRRTRTICSPV